MIVEYTMSESTHHSGEDDRHAEGRCVGVLSRPAMKMQEHDRYSLAEGCGIPIWKSSLSLRMASLQVSRDMASLQEFNLNRIEGSLAPDDPGPNRRVPPRYARREVSKPNFRMILHPAIGNLRKHSIDLHPSVGNLRKQFIDLHPSVGSFKKGRACARKVENVMAGASPGNNTAGAMLNRKP